MRDDANSTSLFYFSNEVYFALASQGDQLAQGENMVHSPNNCLEAIIEDLSHFTARAKAVTPPMHQFNLSWVHNPYFPDWV